VLDSAKLLVKEVAEYSIIPEGNFTENILVKEQYDIERAQVEIFEPDKLIVSEFIDSEKIDKTILKREDSSESDEYKIEDVSNSDIVVEDEVRSEPLISEYKEEKIIKINVENDVEISEIVESEEEQEKCLDYKIRIEATDSGNK